MNPFFKLKIILVEFKDFGVSAEDSSKKNPAPGHMFPVIW